MTFTESNGDIRPALTKALQVIEVFRALHRDMPISEAASFLMIALGETKDGRGISITDLKNLGGFELSTASRYAQHLGLTDKNRDPGLDLVVDHIDPMERRRKYLRITPAGRVITTKLRIILEG